MKEVSYTHLYLPEAAFKHTVILWNVITVWNHCF